MRTEGDTLTFTHIPDNAQVQVFLNNGTSFTGTLRQSAGWPWVSVQGEEPLCYTIQRNRNALILLADRFYKCLQCPANLVGRVFLQIV